MAYQFSVHSSKPIVARKLPLLPRFAFYLDIGGKQFVYKHTPILETLLHVREEGFTLKNFLRIANRQLDEMALHSGLTLMRAPKRSAARSSEPKPMRRRGTWSRVSIRPVREQYPA